MSRLVKGSRNFYQAASQTGMWLVLSILGSSTLRGDLVVRQQLCGPEPMEALIQVKGPKIRTDVGDEKSAIMNVKTGEVVTLMHEPKLIIRTSGELMRTQMEKLKRRQVTMRPLPTGEKESCNGYECDIYQITQNDMKVSLWVAKQYLTSQQLASLKRDLSVWLRGSLAVRIDEKFHLEGVVMKVKTEAAGMTSTASLISFEEKAVDESVFLTPDSYQELSGSLATAATTPQ